MPNLFNGKSYRRQSRRSPVILFLLILLWSLVLGWWLSLATNAQPTAESSTSNVVGTVDPIPQRYELGQELYLENCSSCHIAIPPAVLPTQTWQQLLQDPQHYGVQLQPLIDPPRLLVWNYLRTFSRPLARGKEIPYRVDNSPYFKALHPKVKLPRNVQISGCVSCHPSATAYNFRSLTPEWEKAP